MIQNIRITAQSKMLIAATDVFIDKHDEILTGAFDQELIEVSKAVNIRKAFKELGDINFNHKDVLRLELVGERVLTFILDQLVPAMLSPNKGNSKEGKLRALISPAYMNVYKKCGNELDYVKIQIVIDYVSSMTDDNALKFYQELTGQRI